MERRKMRRGGWKRRQQLVCDMSQDVARAGPVMCVKEFGLYCVTAGERFKNCNTVKPSQFYPRAMTNDTYELGEMETGARETSVDCHLPGYN